MLRGRSQLVESFVWLVPPAKIVRWIALSFVVYGRSSFVESFVLFFPFLCALRERRENERKKEEKEKSEQENKRQRKKRKREHPLDEL